MSDAYEIVYWGGRRVDKMTAAALEETEQRLGEDFSLTQGSYNAGQVAASAGTHDGGGVVDLYPDNGAAKVRALRSVGFAAWFRPELWRDGQRIWPAHVHAVLIGNAKLAPSAQRQVDAYYNHRDGLVSNAYDPTWRPDPIPVFRYPVPVVRYTRGVAIDLAIHHLSVAIQRADDGTARDGLLREQRKVLRTIRTRKTTKPRPNDTAHKTRTESRGPAIDSALDHIAGAMAKAVPFGPRWLKLRKVRRALRTLPVR